MKHGQFTDSKKGHSIAGAPNLQKRMAPQVGLEPTTLRLTAGCSAIELLRSVSALRSVQYYFSYSNGVVPLRQRSQLSISRF